MSKKEEETFSSSSGSGNSEWSSEEISWIKWHCSLKGNEFLCEVDEDWMEEQFNLYGLEIVPSYKEALQVILDDCENNDISESGEQSAPILYGLIHARFILTHKGMMQMQYEKFLQGEFGTCPRHLCRNQNGLPIGLNDKPFEDTVKLFCPKCKEVYDIKNTKNQYLDGSFIGSSFPHLFMFTFPHTFQNNTEKFIPKIFGFKVNSGAYSVMERVKKLYVKQKRQIPTNQTDAILNSLNVTTENANKSNY